MTDRAIAVEFSLNGKPVALNINPAERLLDTVRYALRLTGTKEGCGEGECGACTLYLDDVPVNSCLVPTWQARGRTVRTIESIDQSALEPFLAGGATQCGACTPGVVVTADWVRRRPELLQRFTTRELMAGNLCRCTGYDGIVDSIQDAVERDAGT